MKHLSLSPDLKLPLDWMTLATVVYGARGSGKTTLGRVMAEEVTKAGQRFCTIDLKGDWYGLKSTADGRGEGIPVVVFGGDHADLPLEEGTGTFVGETIAGLGQSAIIDLEHFSKGKQIKFLRDFFLSLYHTNRDPLLLLADEAQRYAPQATRGTGGEILECLGAVEDVVKLGRKHGIGPVLFTQRGSGLNKEVSELCDVLVAFRTPGPLDQDRIKGWLEANRTVEERDQIVGTNKQPGIIAGLDTGTAVFASGHPSLKLFKVAAVRRPETFDSSATPKIGQRKAEPKRLAIPDLEAIKSKMASAIERAKENDPKALKAELARLREELALRPVAEAPKPKVLTKGEIGNILKEMLNDHERSYMELMVRTVDLAVQDITSVAKESHQRIAEALKEFRIGLSNERDRIVTEAQRRATAFSRTQRQGSAAPKQELSSNQRTPGGQPGNGALPRGERAVLTVCGQYPEGATREQITILSGYKRSTRDAYLQRLREKGMVKDAGGEVVIEQAGVDALGPDFRPLPTGAGLREYWLRELPAGEQTILSYVMAAYPASADRGDLSDKTGYKRSTRDAYIQRLSTKLLVYTDRDGVRASDVLFE